MGVLVWEFCCECDCVDVGRSVVVVVCVGVCVYGWVGV